VAFHERDFSVPVGRFICDDLFEYGLQLLKDQLGDQRGEE
jgi:hypothetical protein